MPILYDTGVQQPWDFLAMELLGPSIDSLFRKSGRDVMDLRSVCCLGMQVVSRIVLRLPFSLTDPNVYTDPTLGNYACTWSAPP